MLLYKLSGGNTNQLG